MVLWANVRTAMEVVSLAAGLRASLDNMVDGGLKKKLIQWPFQLVRFVKQMYRIFQQPGSRSNSGLHAVSAHQGLRFSFS